MDFGTNNSYITECPLRELRAKPIIFDGSLKGFSTAILYSENRSPIVGNKAIETYGCMTKEEKKRSSLKMHFKPEILESEEARELSVDYLKGILNLNKIYYRDLIERGETFLFGVPSQATQEYCKVLKKIAQEAGFPRIEVIEEPIGSLIYHLSENNITAHDAKKGVLVVDFGGGTCDFAYMEHLEVVESWGSMTLGGRLFDDLFYQIFLSQDAEHLDRVKEEDDEFIVHWHHCRDVKERFSQLMKLDRNDRFHFSITGYGQIKNFTWDRFIEWAKYYIPSQQMRDYFLKNKVLDTKLTHGESVNLLEWFRDELEYGLEKYSIKRPEQVILAGGSSLWPFVQDILQDLLELKSDSIFCGESPYTVISEGLSLYPALVSKYEKAKTNIEKAYPAFLEEEIHEGLLVPLTKRLTKEISTTLSSHLFQNKVRSLLYELRNNGGKIEDFEEKIHQAIEEFKEEYKVIMEEIIYEEIEELPYQIVKKVRDLFSREGLYYQYGEEIDVKFNDYKMDGFCFDMNGLMNVIRLIMAPITGFILADICGGAGLALIASGPAGWIVGMVLGLIGGYLGGIRAESVLKSFVLPKSVTRLLITKKKIDRLIGKAKNDYEKLAEEYLEDEMARMKDSIVEELGPVIKKELTALTLIASLKR